MRSYYVTLHDIQHSPLTILTDYFLCPCSQFEKDLEANKEDPSKQLELWHKHIDWLEQNIPDGGKVNGITNAIESCIENYYNKNAFKQDERLFDIFLKFQRFCDEPIEMYGFMYANSISTLLSRFYINWSWQYETRKNVKRAQDLIKLGRKNLATPRELIDEADAQLRARIERMIQNGDLDDCPQTASLNMKEMQARLASEGIRAALQTLKFHTNKTKGPARVAVNRIGGAVDHINVGGLKNQTKIVNGVRVPRKPVKSVANKPVQIHVENEENEGTEIADKIPTSQTISQIGKRGLENRPLADHRSLSNPEQQQPKPQQSNEN